MNVHELEKKISGLKQFYSQVTHSAIMSAGFIIVWLLHGCGYFWPIWPILFFAIELGYKAHSLSIFKDKEKYAQYAEKVLNFTKKWEEEQIQKLKQELDHEPKKSTKKDETESENETEHSKKTAKHKDEGSKGHK